MPKKARRKPTQPPRPRGHQTRYRVEYPPIAYRLALLGATDKEMAEAFGISEQAFNVWKHKHPLLLESIKRGKTPADATVAQSLYHRACGITRKAVKIFQHEGHSYEHEFEEYFPPDTGAAMAWLKNRRPTQWRDKPPDVTVNVNNDVKLDLSKPPEEWGADECKAYLESVGHKLPVPPERNGKPKVSA